MRIILFGKIYKYRHLFHLIPAFTTLRAARLISRDAIIKATITGRCFLVSMLMFSVGAVSLPAGGGAAEVKLTPKVAVGGAYDDNVYFTSRDEVDSWLYTISPSIELDYKTLVSNLRLKTDWDILTYTDESDLNRTNQYYLLSADHRIGSRLKTSASFRYDQDTTLNTYLQETGRAVERVQRDSFDGWARVAYNLTMVSGLSARYRYKTTSYDEDDYPEYDTHTANLYYFHRLKSTVDQLSFGPSYYHRTNDLNTVDSFSMDIRWDRDWSSISRSEATIGARYSNVSPNDDREEDEDSWGAIARFLFTYEGEISTTRIDYYHDLRTTADGADVNVDNLYLIYRRSITQRLGTRFRGRLVFSYKLFDQESDVNDERYFWLEPSLYYQFTPNLEISLQYRYQNNVEFLDNGDDQTRERNIVWFQISYGMPFLL